MIFISTLIGMAVMDKEANSITEYLRAFIKRNAVDKKGKELK